MEVCKDISVSGDKSGDMLKGAIIGGIIGNNVGNIENGGALGAVSLVECLDITIQMHKVVLREFVILRYVIMKKSRTVYSHSTIKFVSQGKYYTLNFKRSKEIIMWGRIMEWTGNFATEIW